METVIYSTMIGVLGTAFVASLAIAARAFIARLDDINRRFDDINGRFDDVNRRFDDINGRFDDMNSSVNARFDDVNGRFDDMNSNINARFDDVNRKIEANGRDIRALSARVDGLTTRVVRIETRLELASPADPVPETEPVPA